VRKVGPLKKKLSSLRAWITGVRVDQSETRKSIDVIAVDKVFKGKDANALVKFNPLSHWTSEQVWSEIKTSKTPSNELHEQGFMSIGCQPCTRAITKGQHEREGRWWWENVEDKECGLHQKKA